MRLHVAVVLALGSLAVAAHAAPTATDVEIAGMQATRVEESVFNGHAYVYEAGREHARTVMLVHGIGDDGARVFASHVAWLARSNHVVAVDLPGFGRSDKANKEYSPRNYAAFLAGVAGRFTRGPVTLVGHSMGGLISMLFASIYPDDVDRLVVIDSPGVLHPSVTLSHYLSRLGTRFAPSASSPLIGMANRLLGMADRSGFDPAVVVTSPTLRQTLLGGQPSEIAGLAAGLEDMSAVLPKIRSEALIVWGERDRVVPKRVATILARRIPRAQLVVIDGAGHVPMSETPARFRAALEPFLAQGLAPVSRSVAPMRQAQGDVTCIGQERELYQGEYDTLTLDGCRDVRIHDARVGKLSVERSTVTIENSAIGGGAVGLEARSATVEMTGGRIDGDVAIVASGSRLDLAGVDLVGSEAAIKSPQPSSVVFSISHVRSSRTNADVHGVIAITEDNPL